jgi:glycosyltransferase involved in cell wall biosynthesis
MGLPVLHGVEGESAEIVRDEGVGLLFEPENPEELEAALRTVQNDAELRSALAGRGPVAARKYDRQALASDMLAILVDVARRSSKSIERNTECVS